MNSGEKRAPLITSGRLVSAKIERFVFVTYKDSIFFSTGVKTSLKVLMKRFYEAGTPLEFGKASDWLVGEGRS